MYDADTNKIRAKKILLAYALGGLILILVINTPFSIPCLWKLVTGIPCPGCGLTRAFIYLTQFRFLEAVRMNILFLPLVIGMAAYLICALADLFYDKYAVDKFNVIMNNRWVITISIILMGFSWYYNIIRGI